MILRLIEQNGPGSQRRLNAMGVRVYDEHMQPLKLTNEDTGAASVVVHPGLESDGKVYGDRAFQSTWHVLLVEPAAEVAHLYQGPRIVPPGGVLTLQFKAPKTGGLPYHLADVFVLKTDV